MLVISMDGNILAANGAAQMLFKVPATELVGMPIDQFVPGDERLAHAKYRRHYGANPERRLMGTREIEAELASGERVPVEVSLSPMTVDGSTCLAASIRDVSERRRRQEHLEERRRELERSNKELEQFAYMTLINSREIASKVAEQRHSPVDEDLFDEVSNSAARMSAVTRRMLDYALLGIGDSTPTETDLNPVLSRALNNLAAQLTKKNAVVTADELPCVWGNASNLTQVFQHLLENAIAFAGDTPPEIHIGSQRLGEMIELFVRDKGIGIDKRHHELVFEMFQRLHSVGTRPSSGMGLATCRKIVEHHGGKIRAESTLGEGTTIIFTIPAPPTRAH